MIDKTSRYAGVRTYVAEDSTGEAVEALEPRAVEHPQGAFLHIPHEAERLDHLAWQYLNDPRRFWRICDASDELDPFDLIHPGRSLSIPFNA
ncbi:MAG: hypothetical protein JXB05_02460 [Myxococcaceae bacterium]|nr:hypothetical protein [Myxococcaceae bacterium]